MPTYDLIVTNARISTQDERPHTIAISDGKIVAVEIGTIAAEASISIDAAGRWVIPGAIDTHSHIGQVASEYSHIDGLGPESNYRTESRSALAGGVTTAVNYVKFGQEPLIDAFEASRAAAEAQSRIDILFHGYVMNEDQLAEIPRAIEAGLRSFKIFMPYRGAEAESLGGIGSLDHAQMRRALAALAAGCAQAMVHAEDGDIVEWCTQHELDAGMPDLASYERGRPIQAEGDATWTALYLAEEAQCPVTIVHVSSPEPVRARRAVAYPKAALESCPHYALLNTEQGLGSLAKVAPPLRNSSTAEAITRAVLDGDIDFFGSDHNVWPAASKTDLVSGRAGLPGIGLLLPLVLTHFVDRNGMSMERAIELTSTNAARRFGMPQKGWIGPGADADLVVLEHGSRRVSAAELHSAVDFSPYEGYELSTWPWTTIAGGQLVHRDGKMIDDDHRGRVLNEDRRQARTARTR